MVKGKTVLAITLVRGGSKSIPKKNIAPINGKPLLEYTIDEVKKSKYIDKYIIATDDDEISLIAYGNDIEVYLRNKVPDSQTSSDGLLEVIEYYDRYDYIVEVMCTNPLKTIEDIDGVIEKIDSTRADSVVSVVRVYDNHPSRMKYIEGDQLRGFNPLENPDLPNQRRQDLTPPAYVRNGSVYAMTYKQIMINKMRLGEDTRPYIMDESHTINIDEPRDLLIAEHILKYENK